MKTIQLTVNNIHCDHCIRTIEMELKELHGVKDVKAMLQAKTVEVQFDDAIIQEDRIRDLLTEINYPAT